MEQIRRNFASDNVSPACPEIMEALVAASSGSVPSYGGDPWTEQLRAKIRTIFENDHAEIFPVTTGTASNAIALSSLCPPWGVIFCDESAHILNDECGAPEFLTGGAKLQPLSSPDGRILPETLQQTLGKRDFSRPHDNVRSALSITQATEWGTVYSIEHIRELTAQARSAGLGVHMDGARFSNALVTLGCSPAEATWKSGVDILSLGATKNGAMAAEVMVVFDPARAANMGQRLKRSGHIWSKQRYISAQLLAWFDNDLWLRNAGQANAMATRLASGLARIPGVILPWPTESNEVFVVLPDLLAQHLEAEGFGFYRWDTPSGLEGVLIRLVCGYDTRTEDVDALLESASTI
ncbi:MAG: low specificity L-threonine aldolase [Acetobacter sp.]|jgi:threonine aldolase|nr:low specificity L-threonine aldolase [Acetobacter sp.]MCH4061481.1 low specificity L-threonine aldolase [Acetobacter sp.]MCI1294113.1 low specificity L-threonine aldolase [Acetobacter sp.]MCI1320668.1 low specificity L-threonine aldolase [Acetobacter sp.]MCI1373968.1 low specificity L-threonine aldolase [Acetobacter sp.]